jgi:DNA (cytosine-5)-methyltransferase 1
MLDIQQGGEIVTAYYNEIDPYAAQWLRNLIENNLIPKGEVDERSIIDVRPSELAGFSQCHFFAGIGVWPYALRQAGWPDNRPVWTGSCPCGPFSQAGKKLGFDDERHLWPSWHHLISQLKPETVFGEQVSSKDGLAWFDTVQADMEGTNYAYAGLDICSAGVGAPNIRQRLYFVAYSIRKRLQRRIRRGQNTQRQVFNRPAGCNGTIDVVADAESINRWNGFLDCQPNKIRGNEPANNLPISDMANADDDGCHQKTIGNRNPEKYHVKPCSTDDVAQPGPVNGKWRPIEPGTFPLAPGITRGLERDRSPQERMAIRAARTYRRGPLKGYGNALNAEAASEFVKQAMSCLDAEGEPNE